MPAPGRNLYDASYRRRRDDLVRWALSHPAEAKCWQCGEPLATCGPNRNGKHRNGKPAKWTGGHTRDGDPTAPLQLECSPCNYRRGAASGNAKRGAAKGEGRRDHGQPPPGPGHPAGTALSDSETGPDSGTTVKPTKKPTRKASGATKKASGSPRSKRTTNVEPPPPEQGARTKGPEPAEPALATTLVESAGAAVERALTAVVSTPRRAVLIATVRRLAIAIDGADPADVPKISRELNARMVELMADANPVGEPPDWTQTAAAEEGQKT